MREKSTDRKRERGKKEEVGRGGGGGESRGVHVVKNGDLNEATASLCSRCCEHPVALAAAATVIVDAAARSCGTEVKSNVRVCWLWFVPFVYCCLVSGIYRYSAACFS